MKRLALISISILLLTNLIYAQDIIGKLGGNTANETYDITDSDDNLLFRVQGNGAVGIGTPTPTRLLHLESINNPSIRLSQSPIPWGQQIWDIGGNEQNWWVRDVTTNTYPFQIEVNAPTSSIRIGGTGNVGIGTTSPSAKLEVADIVRVGGDSWPGVGKGMELAYNPTLHRGYIQVYDRGLNSWGNLYLGNGLVGIGTETPIVKFHVTDDQGYSVVTRFQNTSKGADARGIDIMIGPNANPDSGSDFIVFRDGDGDIIGTIQGDGSGSIEIGYTSDRRLKTNITAFNKGLELIDKIRVRKYEMKSAPGKERVGFIAQELLDVYPQAVGGNPTDNVEDSPMSVDYSLLTPLLVQALQDQQDTIEKLTKRMDYLERL